MIAILPASFLNDCGLSIARLADILAHQPGMGPAFLWRFIGFSNLHSGVSTAPPVTLVSFVVLFALSRRSDIGVMCSVPVSAFLHHPWPAQN
jgi:hypothetical protein